ncbi:hypothetical protein [Nocardia acididurans]|nr:hypothetical protein [Nocardia acididurans]
MLTVQQSHGAAGWGIAMSSNGLGIVLGSIVVFRTQVRHLLCVGQAAAIVGAVPLVLVGLEPSLGLFSAGALLGGIGLGVFAVAWETCLGHHVRNSELSRVASYDTLGSLVAVPLGQLAVVPLAAVASHSLVAYVAGGLYVVVCSAPLASRHVRMLRQS